MSITDYLWYVYRNDVAFMAESHLSVDELSLRYSDRAMFHKNLIHLSHIYFLESGLSYFEAVETPCSENFGNSLKQFTFLVDAL